MGSYASKCERAQNTITRCLGLVLTVGPATIASAQFSYTPSAAASISGVGPAGGGLRLWAHDDEAAGPNQSSNWLKSWMTFDMTQWGPMGTTSGGPTINGCTFTVKQSGSSSITSPITIDFYGLTDQSIDNWTESGLTWANAPGNNVNSGWALDPLKTVLVGSIQYAPVAGSPPPSGTTYTCTFDQAGIDMLNADSDGKVTLIMAAAQGTGSESFGIYTNTGATRNQPTMTVMVPEPVAIGGLSVVSLGLLLRKRERSGCR